MVVHCKMILVTVLPGSAPSAFEIAPTAIHRAAIEAVITEITSISIHLAVVIAIPIAVIEVLRKCAGH